MLGKEASVGQVKWTQRCDTAAGFLSRIANLAVFAPRGTEL